MSDKMIVACPKCETRFVAPLEKFLPQGRKVRCAKCGHAWFQNVDGSVSDLPAAAAATTAAASSAPSASATTPPAPSVTTAPVDPVPMPKPTATPVESLMDRATRAVEKPSFDQGARAAEQVESQGDRVSKTATSGIAAATAATAATGAAVAGASYTPEEDYHDELEIDQTPPKRRKRGWFPRLIFYGIAAALIAGALGYFFKDAIAAKVPALDPPLTSWKQNVDQVVSKVIPQNRALRIENVKYDINETADETALLVTADVVNDGSELIEAPKLMVTLYGDNDAVLEELSLAPEDISGEIAADASAPYFLRMPFPPEDLKRVEVDFAK